MLKLLTLILTTILLMTVVNAVTPVSGTIDQQNYVVKFNEPGLLYYNGGVGALKATNPKKLPNKKFDSRSSASIEYSQHLKTIKKQRMTEIRTALGNKKSEIYHYKAMYHGVMMSLTEQEATKLRTISDIKSVILEPIYQIDTERGPKWINADSIWDGSAVPTTGITNQGEGILVGIIDTGINTDHPSFAQVGPVDGYVHVNPLGSGNFVGHCVGGDNDGIPPRNAEVVCNNKLIGAWGLENGDPDAPEDNNGHGSHTASTTAGNHWAGPFYDSNAATTIGIAQVSGVAPHANIIAYDVCASQCATVSAGIDRAILDGVDVINFSISSGSNPWAGSDRQFLDAVNAQIFVAASAGNTRAENTNPIADSNHLGPWVMTVAASTHDRDGGRIVGTFTGGNSALVDMAGQSNTGNYGSASIVYAGDFTNPGEAEPEQCLIPFPANTWTNGEIVVCDRGTIARVLKGVNVLAGGAGGMVLGNVAAGATSVVADFHVLPSVHVDQASGDLLRSWLAAGTGHMAEIINTSTGGGNASVADVLAGFSLRGPNLIFDVTKPSITNPGVSIAAAVSNDPATPNGLGEVGFLSGTSMSSPHTAGSGALMMASHPGWSVSEIKSAMQMTADQTGRKEDNMTAVDPDDVGSGRVDLSQAVNAGLVMDETFANYLASDPNTGGDPKTLNIPSVRNSTCGASCSWTRTLKHKLVVDSNWTLTTVTDGTFTLDVSPTSFSMISNDVIYGDGFDNNTLVTTSPQQITITATGVPTVAEGMAFGKVVLSDDSGNSPDLHITVSVNQALPYGGTPPPDI
ncbi:MAG: S8 family serine peptidase [Alcanivoracaceae bacterium]|nr:S8 family serine peptidase [Alcanivoracaceae bacterium]